MTILSIHIRDDIRRLHDIFVARMAFEYRCEQPDVLAAIQTQPASARAPAAPPAPQAQERAGEGVTTSPATPSPETANSGEASADAATGESPVTPAPESAPRSGGENVAPASQDTVATHQRAGVESSGSTVEPGALFSGTQAERLTALFAERGQVSMREAIEAIGGTSGGLFKAARKAGVVFRKLTKAELAQAAMDGMAKAGHPVEPSKKPKALGKRIAAYVEEHPDATAREVADALGSTLTAVGWAAQKAKIELRKYTAEERSEATRQGILARQPAQVDAPVPALIAPAAVGDVLHKVWRPKATRFRLRQHVGRGKYLHMSGQGLVDSKAYAWIGTEAQLLATRAKFPDAKEMAEEVVE